VLLALWKTLPRTHTADICKLVAFLAAIGTATVLASFGLLPRTRPILAGELMVAD
jgi:hypothetical protein